MGAELDPEQTVLPKDKEAALAACHDQHREFLLYHQLIRLVNSYIHVCNHRPATLQKS